MFIPRALALALGVLLVAGCEPPEPYVFGVPQSQWDSLNQEQQTRVIDGYNAQQQQQTQNEPWIAAIGLAGDLLSAACHPTTKSSGTSRTTSHTHELPNGWQTKSKTKSSNVSFTSPC